MRESAMILAFSYAGLAGGDGLIVSILFGAMNLALGAIGGVVWVANESTAGVKFSTIEIAIVVPTVHTEPTSKVA